MKLHVLVRKAVWKIEASNEVRRGVGVLCVSTSVHIDTCEKGSQTLQG